jgi:hypothetical protein
MAISKSFSKLVWRASPTHSVHLRKWLLFGANSVSSLISITSSIVVTITPVRSIKSICCCWGWKPGGGEGERRRPLSLAFQPPTFAPKRRAHGAWGWLLPWKTLLVLSEFVHWRYSGYPQQETCSDTLLEERCKCDRCSGSEFCKLLSRCKTPNAIIIVVLVFIEIVRTYIDYYSYSITVQFHKHSEHMLTSLSRPEIWETETCYGDAKRSYWSIGTASHTLPYEVRVLFLHLLIGRSRTVRIPWVKGYNLIGRFGAASHRESKERFRLVDSTVIGTVEPINVQEARYTVFTQRKIRFQTDVHQIAKACMVYSDSVLDCLAILKTSFSVIVNLTPVSKLSLLLSLRSQ